MILILWILFILTLSDKTYEPSTMTICIIALLLIVGGIYFFHNYCVSLSLYTWYRL